MTSFGAQIENPDQFMSTFKVKGQIDHRAEYLLLFSGENHKFVEARITNNSRAFGEEDECSF